MNEFLTQLSIYWSQFSSFFLENWDLLIIPLTAALVGWGTNVLALKMTFYPIKFYGVSLPGVRTHGFERQPAIGWQGIIPSKAERMASRAVDLITSKLIDIEEQFAQIDPKVVAKEMEPTLDRLTRRIIDEAMRQEVPLIWRLLSKERKETIYRRASEEFPHVIEDVMAEIKLNIKDLFDLKKMVVEALTKDKALLNRIFLEVGSKEFKFIEQSGIYFGFLFGIVQMVIWSQYDNPSTMWWQLPLGGLLIGYLTNFLALRLIFKPRNPIKIFGLKIQGLFMLRQKEVSKAYAQIVSKNILTMPNIFETIINGEASEKLVKITERHVREGVDKTAGFSSALIRFTSGSKSYDGIKNIACARFVEELPQQIKLVFDYAEQALDIESTLSDKMSGLSPIEFEGFLRPVFQEDEMKLMLVGAALGGLAGLFQAGFLLI